jgi:hypothetical protein
MAKPEHLVLSVLHAGRKDRMVMRSLINLISGRDNAPSWAISEDPGGDVTIVDVDSAAGEQAYRGMVDSTGALVAFSRSSDFQASAVLGKPLRSREFLGLLEQLAEGNAPATTALTEVATEADEVTDVADSQAAADARSESSQASDPGLTLADHLRCQTWPDPIALTSRGWPVLLIDSSSGSWFYDGPIGDLDSARFSELMPPSAGVTLSNSELVERIHGHRQRPLSELKWYAGLAALPGRLHPELFGDPQFMLTQVPPEAMKNEQLHQLARITLRGPLGFEQLLEESGQPEANVAAFLNACFCSGKLLINRTSQASSF